MRTWLTHLQVVPVVVVYVQVVPVHAVAVDLQHGFSMLPDLD